MGAVSLISGEYVEFRGDDPNLQQAVLASTVMPIIWEPVKVSALHTEMVDGGVRNLTPIGDVLDAEPGRGGGDQLQPAGARGLARAAPQYPQDRSAHPGFTAQ